MLKPARRLAHDTGSGKYTLYARSRHRLPARQGSRKAVLWGGVAYGVLARFVEVPNALEEPAKPASR